MVPRLAKQGVFGEVITEDTVRTPSPEEIRLHYALWGMRGPRVVLLHSVGQDHRSWEAILPDLADRYRLLGPDLPGHGESDKPARWDYGVRSMAAAVLRLMDWLDWEDAVFVGNSLGAATALAAALEAPERVNGLVLLNAMAFPEDLPPIARLAQLPFAPILCRVAYPPVVALALRLARAQWGSVTPALVRRCSAYLRSPEGGRALVRAVRGLYGPDLAWMAARYGTIRCPALVVYGMRDPLLRLSSAERLARAIPGATLRRIPRCGHFPHEECPEVVGHLLARYLDRWTRSASISSLSARR